ncbi:hypothetical protein ACFY3U_16595 [Micromonospora sp. NPDC000089]|uniref:hypothetical protein n=1 Tax=unclassified Micromonospora TaxID=2617518 RepID=UPI00369A08E3
MPLLPTFRVPSAGDGLWGRRLLALTAAVAVTVPLAAGLLTVPRVAFHSGGQIVVWLFAGGRLLTERWRPRRDARLVWRPRIAGRDAVEPGLLARRSLAGWVDLLADLVALTALGLALTSLLPDEPRWVRVLRVVLIVAMAAGAGRSVYHELRFTGRLAITASGVRYGRYRYPWADIDRATVHRRDGRVDGVRLRPVRWVSLRQPPMVGGRDTAVPEERLVAAIEEFRTRPHVLAGGSVTAPEPTVEAAGG